MDRHVPIHDEVTVQAPARLHMGFVDLHGGLGRRFGSIGVALRGIRTSVTVRPTTGGCRASGPGSESARELAGRLLDRLKLKGGVSVEIDEAIPSHVGLGSGTQRALAVATAIARLYGAASDPAALAVMADRGRRSGIGIGAFAHGGFLMDGGRDAGEMPPPLLFQSAFPDDWYLFLVFDSRGHGLHGEREAEAFQRLPPFPASEAARLCRVALMQILPAVSERDFEAFGDGVSELQRVVGDYFAPAQGGRFSSHAVREALEWLQARGARAIGQSSWGPTGFCVVDGYEHALELRRRAMAWFESSPHLRFTVAAAQNRGGLIESATAGHRASVPGERPG